MNAAGEGSGVEVEQRAELGAARDALAAVVVDYPAADLKHELSQLGVSSSSCPVPGRSISQGLVTSSCSRRFTPRDRTHPELCSTKSSSGLTDLGRSSLQVFGRASVREATQICRECHGGGPIL